MIDKPITSLNRSELKDYIFKLQKFIQDEQESGKDIDSILDETDIFDEFEEILPDNEFPIFVITILNGFKSEVVMDKLLDIVENKTPKTSDITKARRKVFEDKKVCSKYFSFSKLCKRNRRKYKIVIVITVPFFVHFSFF